MTAADHANTAATLYRLTDELPAKYRAEAIQAIRALAAQAETAERMDANAKEFYGRMEAAEAERDAAVRQVDAQEREIAGLWQMRDSMEAERDAAVQAANEAKFALRTAEAAMLKDRQDVRAAEQAAEQAHVALREAARILSGIDYEEGSRIDRAVVIIDAALAGNQP